MRHVYQSTKSPDYGVNSCESCFQKQLKIDRLTQENESLRGELQRLKRKAVEGFFSSSTPSSKIPLKENAPEEKSKKQGGAKLGHQGHGRQAHTKEEVEEVRVVKVEATDCPTCHVALWQKGSVPRSVLDLTAMKVKKLLYELERKYCPACQTYLQARVASLLPKMLLSNELLSEVVESHYVHGIPLGRITERLKVNYSTIIASLHRLGKLFAPCVESLKEEYRQSVVRHADETSWRVDGAGGYCWLFASDKLSLYLYRQTRSATVVKEVFGTTPLAGYLVVDRYNGYNRVPCKLQYCYAHLSRDLKDEAARFEENQEVVEFVARMRQLLAEAMTLRGKSLSDKAYYREARKIKREILSLCQIEEAHPAIKRWADFFIERAERLYHWVENRAVPAENNRAERELRPTVIARKVSFGSQAEEGAKTREVLLSLIQTLKKREQNPRQKFKEMLDKISQDSNLKVTRLLCETDSS
ncbi:MAG: IS66 family transposase [Pyrinomonadaceae bacterium]